MESKALIFNAQAILGQLDETGRYPIVFREDKMNRANRHIAVIGASGCGKTYTFIVLVVLDGEADVEGNHIFLHCSSTSA